MKTYIYTDELHDDFAGTNIRTKPLPEDYAYIVRHPVHRALAWVLYHLIATPLVFLYQKLVFGERIVGREKLRPYRKSGYYLYGNHTRVVGDAFTPTLVTFPGKAYIITDPDAASIPGLRGLVRDLGSLPLPAHILELRKLWSAVDELTERGQAVVIYPEAHIWPYYTGVRPFRDASFRYPAKSGRPVFTFTVTYHRRPLFRRPGTTVYIDGPFLPEPDRTVRENQRLLREAALSAMTERSGLSDYEYARYVRADG